MDGYYPSGIANPDDAMIPSRPLLKAVLINGASAILSVDNVDGETPSSMYDGAQGFGRVHLNNTLYLAQNNNGVSAKVVDRTKIEDGDTHEIQVEIAGGCTMMDFSATLVWHDPAGVSGCSGSCLLNDLDLLVENESTGKKSFPNGLNGVDRFNNVERIRLTHGKDLSEGDILTISVDARNLSTDEQMYALVVTGCLAGAAGSGNKTENTSSAPSIPPVVALPPESPSTSPTDPSVPVPTTAPSTSYFEPQSGEIEVSFDAESSSFGVMFDVIAKDHDLNVTGLELHLSGHTNHTVVVFNMTGSHVGNSLPNKQKPKKAGTAEVSDDELYDDDDADDEYYDRRRDLAGNDKTNKKKKGRISGWKRAIKTWSVAEGIEEKSVLHDFNPVIVPAGTTMAFYVTLTSKRMLLTKEEDIEPGAVYTENDDLAVTVGTSVMYKFKNPRSGFVFNGVLQYQVQ